MTFSHFVPSNFSFSPNVFHSYISLASQNVALCGNGLTPTICITLLGAVADRDDQALFKDNSLTMVSLKKIASI